MNDKKNKQQQQEMQSYEQQIEPAAQEQFSPYHENANTLSVVQPIIPVEEIEEEDPGIQYLASDMYNRIVALINKFESNLPEDMQAGGRLVSAGNITFSIQDVGYWDPNMIVFYGELSSDGAKVELVQHLSQLNLLLVAVKRTDNIEKPRRVIGFTTKNEPEFADPEETVE